MVSLPLLLFFRVIFFHREGLFSDGDHSSLRHRRLSMSIHVFSVASSTGIGSDLLW